MKFTKAITLNKDGTLKKISGTKNWIVEESFVWYINYDSKNEYIRVEKGFDTDFGSIPKYFWSVFNPTKYVSYILHDYLYRKGAKVKVHDMTKCNHELLKNKFDYTQKLVTVELNRKQSDLLLKEALEVEGMSKLGSNIVYYTLRLFGFMNFKKKELLLLPKDNIMKAYRDLDKLQPRFKKKVELFMKEVGNKVFITESWRSQERQEYLYAFGRTVPGAKKTWTLNSNHTKGLAIDIAFWGGTLYPSDIYSWREIADIAKKYGINWGYDLWNTDKPHFQDNGKELNFEKKIFLDNSKYAKFIKENLDSHFRFNDYLDDRPATIADLKELITLYDQRKNK